MAYRIKTRFPLQSTVLIDDLLKDIIAIFYCKQTKQTTAQGQRRPEDRGDKSSNILRLQAGKSADGAKCR